MLSYNDRHLLIADESARAGDQPGMYAALRKMPLSDFCELMWYRPGEFPSLATALPHLPSEEKQRNWTGHSGEDLHVRSVNHMRLFDIASWKHTGKGLAGKKLLDYGCGWGRLLRLGYYFSPTENIFGIDPMESSLAACRDCGLTGNISKCDAVPSDLPFGSTRFDFVWSFSVFTHLSMQAAMAVLRAMRSRIASDGAFSFTIRPVEFWERIQRGKWPDGIVDRAKEQHAATGFSYVHFKPLDPALGDAFGDTSISLDKIKEMAEQAGWSVAGIDRDTMEPFQLLVTIVPV